MTKKDAVAELQAIRDDFVWDVNHDYPLTTDGERLARAASMGIRVLGGKAKGRIPYKKTKAISMAEAIAELEAELRCAECREAEAANQIPDGSVYASEDLSTSDPREYVREHSQTVLALQIVIAAMKDV